MGPVAVRTPRRARALGGGWGSAVRGLSKGAALFGVNMLVNTEFGNTYSEGEYRGWLSAAGFEGIEVLLIPVRDTHFILARKPE